MDNYINLLKLSVGTEAVDDLIAWQDMRRTHMPESPPRHVTRMWPKREAEILEGGSIYWVIKGVIQCRQRILRLDEVYGDDSIRRCAIVLDPEVVRTANATKRAFQGWRYLKPEDAPKDLPKSRATDDALPDELNRALADIGVL